MTYTKNNIKTIKAGKYRIYYNFKTLDKIDPYIVLVADWLVQDVYDNDRVFTLKVVHMPDEPTMYVVTAHVNRNHVNTRGMLTWEIDYGGVLKLERTRNHNKLVYTFDVCDGLYVGTVEF